MASIYAQDSQGKFKVTLTVTESSYSLENNTSVVAWSFGIESLGRGGFSSYGIPRTATVNGDKVVDTSASTSCSNNGSTSWGSGTKTIAHNADGSKTISISFSATGLGDYSWSGTISNNGTLTLTTIPRASTITLASNSMTLTNTTDTLGYTVTSQGNFYHKLTWKIGSSSTTIWTKHGINNTSESGTISASAILNKLPSATSGNVVFTLTTYSDSAGTNETGSATATCSVTVDTSAIKPSLSLGSIQLDQPSGLGKLVAGYSTAKMTCTTTNSAGASSYTVQFTVSKGSLAVVTATSSPVTVTTNTLPSSTSNYTFKITATVTDSRGATATASKTSGTVYGYAKPVISASFYRTATNSSTSADPAGLYVYRAFSATQTYTLGGSNSVSVSATQDGVSVNSGTWGSLPETSSATLTVTATDSVTSTTKKITVGTAKFPLDLYDNGSGSVGVGLGATAVANKVRSSMPVVLDSDKGVKTVDSGGNEVFLAIYNGSNLWIGSRNTSTAQHIGKTYIGSGYNSSDSAGNDTAYIAVPNSDNTGSSYYKIFHENYNPLAGFLNNESWTSGTHNIDTDAINGVTWINMNGATITGTAPVNSGSGHLIQLASRVQIYFVHGGSSISAMYVRDYANSQWYSWAQIGGGGGQQYVNGDEVSF